MPFGGGGSGGFSGGTVPNATVFSAGVTVNGAFEAAGAALFDTQPECKLGLLIDNNQPLQWKNNGGTAQTALKVDNFDQLDVAEGSLTPIRMLHATSGAGFNALRDFTPVELVGTAVGSLPSAASSTGFLFWVNDATAPVVGSPVAGGGSAQCLVWSNGTAWNVYAV